MKIRSNENLKNIGVEANEYNFSLNFYKKNRLNYEKIYIFFPLGVTITRIYSLYRFFKEKNISDTVLFNLLIGDLKALTELSNILKTYNEHDIMEDAQFINFMFRLFEYISCNKLNTLYFKKLSGDFDKNNEKVMKRLE